MPYRINVVRVSAIWVAWMCIVSADEILMIKSSPDITCECDGVYKTLGELTLPLKPEGTSPGYFHFTTAGNSNRNRIALSNPDVTSYVFSSPAQLVSSPDSPTFTGRELYYAGQPKTTLVSTTRSCPNGGLIHTNVCINCTFDGVPSPSCGLQAFAKTIVCSVPTNISCLIPHNTTTVVVSGFAQENPADFPKVYEKGISDVNWAAQTPETPRELCTVTRRNLLNVLNYNNMAKDGFTVDFNSGRTKRGVKEVFSGIFNGIKEVFQIGAPIIGKFLPLLLGRRRRETSSETNYQNAKTTGAYTAAASLEFEAYDPASDVHDLSGNDEYEELVESNKQAETIEKAQIGGGSLSTWGKNNIVLKNADLDTSKAEYVAVVGDDSVICIDEDTKEAVLAKIGSCFSGGGCQTRRSCVDNGPMPTYSMTGSDIEELEECASDFVCSELRMPEVMMQALEDKNIGDQTKREEIIEKVNFAFWGVDIFMLILWFLSTLYRLMNPTM